MPAGGGAYPAYVETGHPVAPGGENSGTPNVPEHVNVAETRGYPVWHVRTIVAPSGSLPLAGPSPPLAVPPVRPMPGKATPRPSLHGPVGPGAAPGAGVRSALGV